MLIIWWKFDSSASKCVNICHPGETYLWFLCWRELERRKTFFILNLLRFSSQDEEIRILNKDLSIQRFSFEDFFLQFKKSWYRALIHNVMLVQTSSWIVNVSEEVWMEGKSSNGISHHAHSAMNSYIFRWKFCTKFEWIHFCEPIYQF